eukprot:2874371-Prorocentrum_lima.AAC.1
MKTLVRNRLDGGWLVAWCRKDVQRRWLPRLICEWNPAGRAPAPSRGAMASSAPSAAEWEELAAPL